MPTPPRSDAKCIECLQAFETEGSISAGARSLDMDRNTFRGYIRDAEKRGLHLSSGSRDAMESAGLNGVEIKGGWRRVQHEDGSFDTVRWSAPPVNGDVDILEKIRDVFADLPVAPVVPSPNFKAKDLMTAYLISDAHLGMMSWGKETGEDYDTKKGADRLVNWIGQAIASAPVSETAIILSNGDLTHADDQTNQTPRSKHALDVDTRHYKTLDTTIIAVNTSIELALRKHKNVEVAILPGNHDMTAYMAVLFAVAERWRENPRVMVDRSPNEFFAKAFGKVMLAAHHGDKAKAERLVLFLADEYPEMWGQTRHRYLFTGHLHHHKSADIGGMRHEQLRAVAARDAYAHSHAYCSKAQLQAITYHKEKGEIGRISVGC